MFKQITKPCVEIDEGDDEMQHFSGFSSLNISASSYTQFCNEDESFQNDLTEKCHDSFQVNQTPDKNRINSSCNGCSPNIGVNQSFNRSHSEYCIASDSKQPFSLNIKDLGESKPKSVTNFKNKSASYNILKMKEAYDQYKVNQKQRDIQRCSKEISSLNQRSHSYDTNTVKNQDTVPKIMETDDPIRNLEEFIQNKVKCNNEGNIHSNNIKQSQTMNLSQSQHYFNFKKESLDDLDEMRNKIGNRSQTTKRLIKKIKNDSVRSKRSNYEVCASLPSLNTQSKDYFNQEDDNVKIEDKEELKQNSNKKHKCFEYPIHKINSTHEIRELNYANEEQKDQCQYYYIDNNELSELSQKYIEHCAVNPLVLESIEEIPQCKPVDGDVKIDRIDYKKDKRNSGLSYLLPDVTNSYDLSNAQRMSQHQVISQLNSEMHKLLNTLSLMDNECHSLRYQLHLSQLELTKVKLSMNEQINLNNTIKFQKEARERELDSAKVTMNLLQQSLKSKEKEIERIKEDFESDAKVKENEIIQLKIDIEKLKSISKNESCQEEFKKLKQENQEQNDDIQNLTKNIYICQMKILELNETISLQNNDILKSKLKSENLTNSCMKIYCYFNSPETFDNSSEFEFNKIVQSNPKYDEIVSLFQSSEFYKKDFFKIIKDKFDHKIKDIKEKLSYSEDQRDQLTFILDKRNKELSVCISDNNKLQNIIEMQKVSLNELQKDFDNIVKQNNTSSIINSNNSSKQILKIETNNCSHNNNLTNSSSSKSDTENLINEPILNKNNISLTNSQIIEAKLLNSRGRLISDHSMQSSKLSKGTRSFSQSIQNSLYEFNKNPNKSVLDQKKRNQENETGSLLCWDPSSNNQIRSYSTLNKSIKSLAQKEICNKIESAPQEPVKQKSKRVNFIENDQQKSSPNKINRLQQIQTILANLNTEKQKLEQEITKFPTTGEESLRDIKHKRDVEQNLEYIENNISQIKLKLKEINEL